MKQAREFTKEQLTNAVQKYRESTEGLEEILRTVKANFPELNDSREKAAQAHTALKLIMQDNLNGENLDFNQLFADETSNKTMKDHLLTIQNFVKEYHSLVKSKASTLDSAFVQKAVGVALMVLGALGALLSALSMAVNFGLLSTAVLAPVGAVGAYASVGANVGSQAVLATGYGLFVNGRNVAREATKEPLSLDSFAQVNPD